MARRTAEQAAATRRELIEAALAVFGERGFAAARLDQIADKAGVTRGALYHHFKSKADVYDAVLREEADRRMRPLLTALDGRDPPLERLGRFVRSYCDALEQDARFRAVLEVLLFSGGDSPEPARDRTGRGYGAWLHAFQGLLEEAGRRGDLRPGISPATAARALLALAVGLTSTALQSPGLFSPSQAAGPLYDALLGGIAAQPTGEGAT